MYGFNAGELGLTLLCITASAIIALACYIPYPYFHVNPTVRARGLLHPETCLVAAMVASSPLLSDSSSAKASIPSSFRFLSSPRQPLFIFPTPEETFVPDLTARLSGWTSHPSIYWIANIIDVTIYSGSIFIFLQCLFVYIPITYPQYGPSLLAGNNCLQSALAASGILFADLSLST